MVLPTNKPPTSIPPQPAKSAPAKQGLYEITGNLPRMEGQRQIFKLKFIAQWDPHSQPKQTADKTERVCQSLWNSTKAVYIGREGVAEVSASWSNALFKIEGTNQLLDPQNPQQMALIPEDKPLPPPTDAEIAQLSAQIKTTVAAPVVIPPQTPKTEFVPKEGEIYEITEQHIKHGVQIFKLKKIGEWDPNSFINKLKLKSGITPKICKTLWDEKKAIYFTKQGSNVFGVVDGNMAVSRTMDFSFEVDGRPINIKHFKLSTPGKDTPEDFSNQLVAHLNPVVPSQVQKFEPGELYEITHHVGYNDVTVVQIKKFGKYEKGQFVPTDQSVDVTKRLKLIWNTRRAVIFYKTVKDEFIGLVSSTFLEKNRQNKFRFEIDGVPIKNQELLYTSDDVEGLYEELLDNYNPNFNRRNAFRSSPSHQPNPSNTNQSVPAMQLKTQENLRATDPSIAKKELKPPQIVLTKSHKVVAIESVTRTAPPQTTNSHTQTTRSSPIPNKSAASSRESPPPTATPSPTNGSNNPLTDPLPITIGVSSMQQEATKVNAVSHAIEPFSLLDDLPADLQKYLKGGHPILNPINPNPSTLPDPHS